MLYNTIIIIEDKRKEVKKMKTERITIEKYPDTGIMIRRNTLLKQEYLGSKDEGYKVDIFKINGRIWTAYWNKGNKVYLHGNN
jgi:hypothetical protein